RYNRGCHAAIDCSDREAPTKRAADSGDAVMKRGLFLAFFAASLLVSLAWAGEQPPTVSAASPSAPQDHYDFVFLGESRPVLLRLHVRIDGVPLRQAWEQFTDGLFRFLDRDGNGVLSQDELRRLPRPEVLLQLLRGMPAEMRPASSRTAPEVEVSLVPGKVTREGLKGYYQQKGIEPFVAFIQDKTAQA